MNSKAAERPRTISYFDDKLLVEVATSTWPTSTVHDIYEILGGLTSCLAGLSAGSARNDLCDLGAEIVHA